MVSDLHHKINELIGQKVKMHRIDSLVVMYGAAVNLLAEIKPNS